LLLEARIAFYMDEHVPSAVSQGLRLRGVDVLTAQDAGMRGASGEDHLALAVREERTIFTQDAISCAYTHPTMRTLESSMRRKALRRNLHNRDAGTVVDDNVGDGHPVAVDDGPTGEDGGVLGDSDAVVDRQDRLFRPEAQ
jgi:hypothetical protein